MPFVTGQYRHESSSAEKEARELLENEIEDRKIALEKLEAQSCCDCCGTQLDETFRIRMTKYSEKLPNLNLMIEKVLVSVECADCHREYDSQQQPERMVATKDEIDRAIEMCIARRRRYIRRNHHRYGGQ